MNYKSHRIVYPEHNGVGLNNKAFVVIGVFDISLVAIIKSVLFWFNIIFLINNIGIQKGKIKKLLLK